MPENRRMPLAIGSRLVLYGCIGLTILVGAALIVGGGAVLGRR